MKKTLLIALLGAFQFVSAQISLEFEEGAKSYDFGKVEIGDTAEVFLTVKNTGSKDVWVQIEEEVYSKYPGVVENKTLCTNPKGAYNTESEGDMNSDIYFLLQGGATKDITVKFVPEQYAYTFDGNSCLVCKVQAKGTACSAAETDSLGIFSSSIKGSYEFADSEVKQKSVVAEADPLTVSVTGEGVERAVGLDEKNNIDINLYPNPAINEVSLSRSISWKLRSMSGIELANGVSETINISEYPQGVYFVELSEGGKVSINKIVKQ